MQLIPKKRGYGLEMKTFTGKSGNTYLVIKGQKGDYHTFVEVQAKDAAVDCGCNKPRQQYTPRQMWGELWKK